MWLVWLEASVKQLFKNWILSCKLRASNWTCLEKSLKLSSHALHRFSSGLAMFSMSKLHKICRISRESTMELKGRCQNEAVKSWSTALSLVASNRFSRSEWSESEWWDFWSSCMKLEDSFWTEWCHNDVIMMFDGQLSRSTWFILIWDIGRTKKNALRCNAASHAASAIGANCAKRTMLRWRCRERGQRNRWGSHPDGFGKLWQLWIPYLGFHPELSCWSLTPHKEILGDGDGTPLWQSLFEVW